MTEDEPREKSFAEVMGDDAPSETEDPKAITRSIHIETRYAVVTITTQDEKEDIEVLLRPLWEIPRLIREGEITHSLVVAAFYRLFVEHGDLET